jgi:hypothetical protein
MKTAITLIFYTLIICLLSGCASVRFYSGPDLTQKTGLRFYTLKPYLLVELNSQKDNTVKTTVLYLPDLSNPQYILFKPGIGSSELKLAFTNSALNSCGLAGESRIPETINSLASLLSKGSEAFQQSSLAGINPRLPSSDNFKLYEIVFTPDGTTLKEVTSVNK